MSVMSKETGAISGLLVAVIGLSVLVLGLGSFGIWAFVSYNDAQDNVNGKISIAVAEAKQEQGDKDEAKYAERIKDPRRVFKAPDDYCGLTLKYANTWSAYQSEQLSNGSDYRAYFAPGTIPVISSDTQYALRVFIEQKDYNSVINRYQSLVASSKLKTSTGFVDGKEVTRFDGNFSNFIKGSAVVVRCRQQTITIATDADLWKKDFEDVLKTVSFNQ